jgi:RNA polymerase sigma-70 factor (ECF subfamily)
LPVNIEKGLILGDEDTYIYLFREYYVCLCAYSRRYVGRKDIAEEIVSETFFQIWANRSRIRINASVKAYLFQAVCNNSLNYLRNFRKESELKDFFMDISSENIAFCEDMDDIETHSLIMDDINKKVEEEINNLPLQQQKVFRLKRFEGRKLREIAEIMGISVKTVEMHLSKATINLRLRLKDYLPSFLLFMMLK